MKLNVLIQKNELNAIRLTNQTIIIFDILFATTTIVAALDVGAEVVIPVCDFDQARLLARQYTASDESEPVLLGEYKSESPADFIFPAPLAVSGLPLAGRRVIFSSTNGTVAFSLANTSGTVYAGSLRNNDALAEHIVQTITSDEILLVCAGSYNQFNMEDFYGAGHFAKCLTALMPHTLALNDAAKCALALAEQNAPQEFLAQSRVGTMVAVAYALADDLAFSSHTAVSRVIAQVDRKLGIINVQ